MPQKAPRTIDFEGQEYEFPSDATDTEISAFLKAIPASNAAEVPNAKTWSGPRSVIEMGATRVTSDAPEQPPTTQMERTLESLRPVAHPGTKGDVLGLVIPEANVIPVSRAVHGSKELPVSYPTRTIADKLGDVLDKIPAVGFKSKIARAVVGTALKAAPVKKTFQDLPLAVQMEQLPREATATTRSRLNEMLPDRSRGPSAPATGQEAIPFHERPLYQQMEELPATGAPERTRSAGPPLRGDAPTVLDQEIVTQLKRQGLSDAGIEKLISQLRSDVERVRTFVSAGETPATAIRTIAKGSTGYADQLQATYSESVKANGLPIPDALKKLMHSSSMQGLPNEEQLAAEIAKRNATGSWKP